MKTLAKMTLIASALAFTAAPTVALDGHGDKKKMAKEAYKAMKMQCKESAKKDNADASDEELKAAVKKCMKDMKAKMKKDKEDAPSS